jgi:hypothetical protein
MIIVDSIKRAEQIAFKHYESEQERYSAWLNEHSQLCRYNDDPATSPLEAGNKIGKPMLHVELERRLAKLNPRLHFQWGPLNDHHKLMCVVLPNGQLLQLFTYPTGAIPERSIFRKCEEWVTDPDYVPSPGDVDRADWEWVPAEGCTSGFIPDHTHPEAPLYGKWARKDDNSGRAGWKKLTHAWGEHRRGWRTVLVSLVAKKLLTVQQAEDEFLADNTPEWARHTGKKDIFRPW